MFSSNHLPISVSLAPFAPLFLPSAQMREVLSVIIDADLLAEGAGMVVMVVMVLGKPK